MSAQQAFNPLAAANSTFFNSVAVTIAVTNTTVALPQPVSSGSPQVRLFNNSSNQVAVCPGNTAGAAVAVFPVNGTPANGYVLAAGEDTVISLPPQAAFLGLIGSAAGGTLYITQGEGQ